MLTDIHFYAVAVPAVALYGLSKGGLSGVSLLAMPLMSLFMAPMQAAAILLPVLVAQDVVTVYTFRQAWDRETLVRMLPGALLGIGFGSVTAALVTPGQIRLAVGLLAIAFCLNAWFGAKPAAGALVRHDWTRSTGLAALSGYASFVIHAGGVPYNLYTLPRLRSRELFVGTSSVFFALINLFKIVPYWGLGQFTIDNLQLSAVLLPVAILANMAGIWLVRRIPTVMFYRAILGLTFCVGLKLVVDGLRAI
jgi:uncharacterized protein